MSKLLTYEEALHHVLAKASPTRPETVDLAQLLGRVLVEPVCSKCDLPIFDNSAVDGYAIRFGLTPEFRLVGEVRAGGNRTEPLNPGEAARIFTGAPVPPGTDAVAMQEVAVCQGDIVRFSEAIGLGDHIRRQGEELRKGDVVVQTGRVGPAEVAAIAASGNDSARVAVLPKLGILVTGDELSAPGQPLHPGHIYESNGVALCAALTSLGYPGAQIERCGDAKAGTEEAVARLLDECDVLITSGGVSVGEHDLLRPAFEACGVEQKFWGVAIKPGKPVYFGTKGDKVVFGLPGNPLSALITFYLFVRPYLFASSGLPSMIEQVKVPLLNDLRKKPGRKEFVPCVWTAAGAEAMEARASHKSSSLCGANGLAILEAETTLALSGTMVDVLPLDWTP